jgi:hypothetical protein
MSDNRQDSASDDPEIYDNLRTEELGNLISHAFYVDNIDIDKLDMMMDAYGKREGALTADAASALEEFRRDYLGHDETFPYQPEDAENKTQTTYEHSYTDCMQKRFDKFYI